MGLFNAKARYFDPQNGRFLSQDSFLGQIGNPPSLHRYFYANDNPLRFVDPSGHAAGDLLDPRTYASGAAWQGLRQGYFDNAADIGDSLGGFAKGFGQAGANLVAGGAKLIVKGNQLQLKLATGNIAEKKEALQESWAIAKGAGHEVKQSASFLKQGVTNPGEVLDAAAELGISRTGEVVGGATFDTALLLAPQAKGAQAATIAEEGIVAATQQGALRAQVLANIAESQAARQASRFAEYADSATVQAAEANAAANAAAAAAARVAASGGSPAHLTAGQAWEQAELASLGKTKNTEVWRPTAEDINSAAFKVIVGPAKYTKGEVPVGTIVDVAENGAQVEIKGGSTALESSYQLRLQTYRALKTGSALTIRTTRPVNPTFSAWLERWGASVESASAPPGMH